MTNNVPEAESVPPEPADPRRRKFLVAGVVFVALLALVGIIVWVDDATSPEAVVEDFFDAIVDKDVDGALSLVGRGGYGVPFGEQATFMHPDAIADGWELLEADLSASEGSYGEERVDVTIGNDKKRVDGTITVSDASDDWKIVDPFVSVKFPDNPLTYIQVNDKTVVADKLFAYDATGYFLSEYKLLPGLYTFFGDLKGTSAEPEPGELMLPDGTARPTDVNPPALELTDTAQDDVQEGVNKLLDDCATFKVRQPALCPFGIDEYFDSGDEYYGDIHDVTWKVEEYPRVRATDSLSDNHYWPGLEVVVSDPGVIKLTATASTRDEGDVKLTAECQVSEDYLRVDLGPDGEPRVIPEEFDGYDLDLQSGFGIDTCGNEAR